MEVYTRILLLLLPVVFCQDGEKLLSDLTVEKGKPLTLPGVKQLRIVNMKGGIYADSFAKLDDVKRIIIENSTVSEIETGALCSNPALKSIEFHFVDLPTITKDVLKSCAQQLDDLVLGFGHEPGVIEPDAFAGVERLSTLHIRHSSITEIGEDFFRDLKHLHVLNIVDCAKLGHIHPGAFANLKDLLWSAVQSTAITDIEGLYKNKPKLTKVNLDKNQIKKVTIGDFDGSPALNYFNFGNNQLTTFDVGPFVDKFYNLQMIVLNGNSLDNCPEILKLVQKIQAERRKLGIHSDCAQH